MTPDELKLITITSCKGNHYCYFPDLSFFRF